MNSQLLRRFFYLCLVFGSTTLCAQNQKTLENVIVIAHPLSGEGLAQAVDVLEGDELERKLDANIGATLAKQPGIHSAAFGNAVGRPIIHGLSGPRVRIMEDRIDTLDVSVTSGDHAVGVDPFIAERIEVLKGSSTLLYGSGAIGGVIDIHTARIPHRIPENGFSGGIESRFDNNTDGSITAVKLNGGAGQIAWHLDGAYKEGGDYEIPGFAESARLRALEPESGEEEVYGTLPGSHHESNSGAAGVSYLTNWGFVGMSLSKLRGDYGLPGGHVHSEEDDSSELGSTPTLNMDQTRTDFELGVENPFGIFTSLNIRAALNDYEHQEKEPDGAVATNFKNKAWEARAELVYEAVHWKNVFGFQQSRKEFSAVGEEAFIPPVDTAESGVFWVAERSFNVFDLETGLRFGRLTHEPSTGLKEDFATIATSLGVVIPLSNAWQVGLIADYSSRAPVAEELYTNGLHIVTNTFERGNDDLTNEDAINFSATIQYLDTTWAAHITGYFTQFSDFIYQQNTGEVEAGVPVVEYRQDDALFTGIDAELSLKVAAGEEGDTHLKAMFDYVYAKLDINGNDVIPRTPPMRFGFGVESRWENFSGSVDYLWVHKQDDVTDLELLTDGYHDLSAYLDYELQVAGSTTASLFLKAKNLTDDEQRIHTSFIKEFAPASGRSIQVGVRLEF